MLPTFSGREALAVPEVTAVPFTLTVAVASVTVGVTVIEDVALTTEAVYAVTPAANTGLKVPVLRTMPESEEMPEDFGNAAIAKTLVPVPPAHGAVNFNPSLGVGINVNTGLLLLE